MSYDDVVLTLTTEEYRTVLAALGWMESETGSFLAADLQLRLEREHGEDPAVGPR